MNIDERLSLCDMILKCFTKYGMYEKDFFSSKKVSEIFMYKF